jgi:hypothetical protein
MNEQQPPTDPFHSLTFDEACNRLLARRPDLAGTLRNPDSTASALVRELVLQSNTVMAELMASAQMIGLDLPSFDLAERIWQRFDEVCFETSLERAKRVEAEQPFGAVPTDEDVDA